MAHPKKIFLTPEKKVLILAETYTNNKNQKGYLKGQVIFGHTTEKKKKNMIKLARAHCFWWPEI